VHRRSALLIGLLAIAATRASAQAGQPDMPAPEAIAPAQVSPAAPSEPAAPQSPPLPAPYDVPAERDPAASVPNPPPPIAAPVSGQEDPLPPPYGPERSAPAPPPPSAASAEAPELRPTREGPRCLFGSFCFGPVLTAGALDVFGVGAHGRSDYWGVGIDYQFIWFSARGIPVRLSLLTVEGRVYPFGNAFFLAVGVAWQAGRFRGQVDYEGGDGVPPFSTTISGYVNVPVLKLGLGVMGRDGFVMGIDLALGIQLGGNTVEFDSGLPPGVRQIEEVMKVENDIRKRADTFIRDLPFLAQVNLIRFGFLF
jgi:hypothetical protein